MLRLVDAQARGGRAREAAATLALYLSQSPQSVAGLGMLGRLELAAGNWDAAIETLEGVRVRIGHGEAGLLADLALAYAGEGDGEVAVRYARAAYALQPMNAAVCDAYGVALAEAGRTVQARQLFDKALKLAPGDRAIQEHRRQIG
jgi:tetratricopeptide (TPR) repeat protein